MSGKIRFAPSPTGYLHEGHLLSALYVWAAAEVFGLKIHLRIEDHDQSRARPEYIRSIYEDLEWFGFTYDSQSIQSGRDTVYRDALARLERTGLVYPCFAAASSSRPKTPRAIPAKLFTRASAAPSQPPRATHLLFTRTPPCRRTTCG